MTGAHHTNLEIVATMPSPEALEEAIASVTSAGWDRSELSVLAQRHLIPSNGDIADPHAAAVDQATDTQGVTTDPDVRQTRTLAAGMAGVIAAFVASGATILTGGAALTAIVGAAAAGGGAMALTEGLAGAADKQHGEFLHKQVERGGILLWIKLHGPADETKARNILARHGATEIRVYPLAGAASTSG